MIMDVKTWLVERSIFVFWWASFSSVPKLVESFSAGKSYFFLTDKKTYGDDIELWEIDEYTSTRNGFFHPSYYSLRDNWQIAQYFELSPIV